MDLSMTRLRTAAFTIAVTQNGVALDLTNKSLTFCAASGQSVTISKSSPSNGITITNALAGLATLQINPSDTAGLPAAQSQTLTWNLNLADGANVYPLASGNLSILLNVG